VAIATLLVAIAIARAPYAAVDSRVLFVVADAETETAGINAFVTPEKQAAETDLGKEVENAVKDGLGVRRNNVSTLAEAPADGVEDPKEAGECAAEDVRLADIAAEDVGVLASLEDEYIEDVEERRTTLNTLGPI